MDVTVITRLGAVRILRFALARAQERPRRKLTFVTKSNAQRHAMVLWDEVFEAVRADFHEVLTERVLVDAMAARFVLRPESLDG